MLDGHERLIFIDGMAHSGTTILAYVLRQHPDIFLFTNGGAQVVLESDDVAHRRVGVLSSVLYSHTQKWVLVKRPWMISAYRDWLIREIPKAKFIYCEREFDKIVKSWEKPTSFVANSLREASREQKRLFHEIQTAVAHDFGRYVQHLNFVKHQAMLDNPKKTVDDIAEWLGLAPFEFDVSMVGEDKDIKAVIGAELTPTV